MARIRASSRSLHRIAASCSFLVACCDEPPDPIRACDHASIQEALDAAPDGWRVSICDGIHDESFTIRWPVILYGESQHGTLITGGGARAIASIDEVFGPVVLQDLTLRPPGDARRTTIGLSIIDSPRVTVSRVVVDFDGVAAPPPGEPPELAALIGVDVATAGVALVQSTIRNVGPADHASLGLRVRGQSIVEASGLAIERTGGSAVLASDGRVRLDGATIRGGNTDGVTVLSGAVELAGTTVEAFQADGLSVSGGYLRTDGVQIAGALRYGVLAAGGILDLNDTRIEEPGEGIHATFGLVAASRSVIRNARELGLYAHDSGAISFEDGVIEGGEVGVFVDFADAYVTMRDTRIEQSAGRGIDLRDGQLLMTGGSIEAAGGEGVWAAGGSVILDAVTVSDSGADGVVVTGSTRAALSGITAARNDGWGVLCDGGGVGMESAAHLDVCTGFFDDNDLGPFRLFNNCQILYQCIPL